MNDTLLHLVSGERMQNLLPLLALKPKTVFQLCSDKPEIFAAAEHTEAAARAAGIDADFRIHKLPGATPTTEAVRHAHKQLISVFPGAVANITGGTKLMSLGAYLGASEFHDSPMMKAEPKPSSVERVSNLLDGAWLELAVAAMAGEGSRYGDIHWSVQPPDQAGADYGETDLIAVDREKLNLAVISCKTSTRHVSTLEHLSSWRDRARTLGGSHAAGHLCLFQAKSPDEAARLHAMGRTMGIHIHIGHEIPHHFSNDGRA